MSTAASPAKRRTRDTWTSQTGFLMAAIGSAIGLGNIWRFPGVAYTNGGEHSLFPISSLCFLLVSRSFGSSTQLAISSVEPRRGHSAA